jgi:hypothetical protein
MVGRREAMREVAPVTWMKLCTGWGAYVAGYSPLATRWLLGPWHSDLASFYVSRRRLGYSAVLLKQRELPRRLLQAIGCATSSGPRRICKDAFTGIQFREHCLMTTVKEETIRILCSQTLLMSSVNTPQCRTGR